MSGPAVLADGWLGGVNGARARVEPGLFGLLPAAELVGCDVVYVVGPDELGLRPDESSSSGDSVTWYGAGSRCSVRRPGAEQLGIVWVGRDTGRIGGPWDALAPRELLDCFALWRQLTGVDWRETIGRTIESLILATHPRAHGGRLLDRHPVIPDPLTGGALELAWGSWARPFAGVEGEAAWVHAFDQNAQYLAAWQVAELGMGERPSHHGLWLDDLGSGRDDGPVSFMAQRAGFWRIPGVDKLPNPYPLLPPVATPGREWFDTATVRRLLEVCDAEGIAVPEPVEAWLWPSRSRFLRGAAERLRDARAGCQRLIAQARADMGSVDELAAAEGVRRLVAADTVAVAVKMGYAVETGRFSRGIADGDTSPWLRADWGHTVRATARCNLHRKLAKLGAAPFAIATDGLLFATSEPDAAVFAAAIGLPLGAGLGEFTHEGTAPLEAVRAEIDDGQGRTVVRSMFEAVTG